MKDRNQTVYPKNFEKSKGMFSNCIIMYKSGGCCKYYNSIDL